MFWLFNTTNVKVEDDSLEVQSKEHAVKAFNQLMKQVDELEEKRKPLIQERDKVTNRQIELCDLARVCLVLVKILDTKLSKKTRTLWNEYIKEHGELVENKKKLQLDIDTLSLTIRNTKEKAQDIFREYDLHTLKIDFPY